MKELVQKVIIGELSSVKLPYLEMNKIIETLEEIGLNINIEDMDTNGWDVDFWIKCYFDSKIFMFSGSWWYGDYTFKVYKNGIYK